MNENEDKPLTDEEILEKFRKSLSPNNAARIAKMADFSENNPFEIIQSYGPEKTSTIRMKRYNPHIPKDNEDE